MASTAFQPHHDPLPLVAKMRRVLPDFTEVCELDGFVYVERDHATRERLRSEIAGVLRTIYGDGWRGEVDGFEE